ncbi:Metallo-dependent phosphatase-like protein [Aspergillus lucknowensis]|uniref:Metallo-dependent phosphatase-like protein n=1 Tax=Aspergillus lucknowensis TaxID=176173 RepID=A0ABR4LEZ7_9EURO
MIPVPKSLVSLSAFSAFSAVLATQPSAPDPIPAPLRDLKWGQLNFLHTTDTHGWLAGHLQEPSYSADWGDYVSFATRMREIAEAHGRDLLVIDTGDRVEGNGLYDSSEPKGTYTSQILRQQHIDVMSSGNHELYKKTTSEAEFLSTVPSFHGHYLASNIDIFHPTTGELVPLAARFKKFITQNQGARIVAFGFLFDFTMNCNNTVVQPVEETIKERWFQEVVLDKDVDLFLVVGHVPVHSREYDSIFKAIRAIHPETPIQFFGGHYHIRDCARFDSNAYGLASGRFMETIGFMSIDGLSLGDRKSRSAGLVFNRRYIDNNLFSFHHHTGLNETTFPTERGRNVSRLIRESRTALQLDEIYGCVPRTLWVSRVPHSSEDSIYTWLHQKVLPDVLKDKSRSGKPALAIVNTGAIRFDLFKGEFTRDSAYIVSPFTSGFRYLKDVPYDKAALVLEILNKQPKILAPSLDGAPPSPWSLAAPEQAAYRHGVGNSDDARRGGPTRNMPNNQNPMFSNAYPQLEVVPGYTTIDDLGADGDDTLHSPVDFYQVPNCIDSLILGNESAAPETVDLVYVDFIEPYITLAARYARLSVDVPRESDIYMPSTSLTDLIVQWVKDNWSCMVQP